MSRVWRLGDDVDTDQIIAARYLSLRDLDAMARHALESALPGFAEGVGPGDVIVAGENFGCGSSREHAVLVLKRLGVAAVLCASAARTFYRNAFNNGLPVLECPELVAVLAAGEEVDVDVGAGRVVRRSTGTEYALRPLPPFMAAILAAGGLVPYLLNLRSDSANAAR